MEVRGCSEEVCDVRHDAPREDGNVPAIVGAVIGIGFVGLNLVSGLAMLLFG